MKYYIKYIDQQFINHPVSYDNLIQVYSDFNENINNYNYIPFTRPDPPRIGDFEVLESEIYSFVDGVASSYWNIRYMTQQEAEVKKAQLLDECSKNAANLLTVADYISVIQNFTSEQKQEYIEKLTYFRNNPVMYPNLCCSGTMPVDTGKTWPSRYN